MNARARRIIRSIATITGSALAKVSPLVINPEDLHPQTEGARSELTQALAAMFEAQKQIAIATAQKLLKEEEEKPLADLIDEAIKELYPELVKTAEKTLEQAAKAGIQQTVSQATTLDISMIETSIISDLNATARDWAKDRAAEMVGMKWADGVLIENPNAEYAISQSTRDHLRIIVSNAFETETPLESLIEEIQTAGPFTPARAEKIARTEVSDAQSAGNYETWKVVGVLATKWLLSSRHEETGCDCELNANATAKLGGVFPSGHLRPPAHPHCDCVLVAVEFSE
jgi:hypothetical protein